MSRFIPVEGERGMWLILDRVAGARNGTMPNPALAYADERSAQSWCDLRNAIHDGEDQDEIDRLRIRHQEIAVMYDTLQNTR